ncbi:hypothetical protein BSKO_09276 [Bryopsis sp. KO-2023]|nr:hypothetical protein BSKO_09276 [Bryopsis sp. KO-2023]
MLKHTHTHMHMYISMSIPSFFFSPFYHTKSLFNTLNEEIEFCFLFFLKRIPFARRNRILLLVFPQENSVRTTKPNFASCFSSRKFCSHSVGRLTIPPFFSSPSSFLFSFHPNPIPPRPHFFFTPKPTLQTFHHPPPLPLKQLLWKNHPS